MLKKIKSPGIICIILAITTLILAALIGIIWMLAPSDADDDLLYQGGLNLGSSNGVLYNVTSDETLGSVYLKTQTYGNFDGKKWDEAVPEYDELIDSEYSANYLTGLALKNSEAKRYSITIQPTTNKYVLPYYVSTDAYGDYENIQTSDIKNEGNANAAYSVYFYKYTAADAIAHSSSVAEYESEYSQFVKENYLHVDDDTLAFLNEVISENELSASDSDIISKVTLYIRSVAKYDLLYDIQLDKEDNTVISFMSGEYESGVCRHFASSAALLYRALGIPARYATGYLTAVQKDVTTAVTALNAHAWVEVYIEGIGWIKVEPTPPLQLESPSDDAEPPVQSLGLFKVSSDNEADIFLKTNSYCDYIGNGWDEAYEYTETMFGGYSAQYLTGMAIAESYNYLTNELEITPLADLYALPYYLSTEGFHTIQTSDRVVSGDTNETYTVSYYSTLPDDATGKSAIFTKFEEKYLEFVKESYLNIDNDTYAYMNYIIESQGWKADDINIVALVCEYLKDNYDDTWEYNESLDESENYVIDFLEVYKEGSPQHFAAAATLIFRALGIPARFTEGYAISVPEDSVYAVTFEDTYFWVEIYREGCGWVMVDVLGRHTMREDLPPEEVDLFQIYADSDEEKIYLKQESFGAYNGQGFDYMTNIYGEYYNEYSAAYIPGMLIENGIYSEHNIYINMLTDEYDIGYMLPYYMPAYMYGAEIQHSDVSIEGPRNYSYGAKYYDYELLASIGQYPGLEKFESSYRNFVYQNYLDTYDYETFEYIYQKIIIPNGFDRSNPYIIEDVARYIQNSAIYNIEYDTDLDSEENVLISFLEDYREGVCRHYAMAATMVYRALGIPARYTVGFVTPTKADEWVTVTTSLAHAWVEVYIDGFGWKPVEVTGGFPIDEDEIHVETVEIILDDTEKKFDGSDFYPTLGYRGFEKYENMGYSLNITPYVPFSMPGKSKIQLASYTVFDASGNDVTERFNITLGDESGKCFTYIDEIVVSSNSGTVPYSGSMYSGDIFGYDVNGQSLMEFVFDNHYVNYTREMHTVEIVTRSYIKNVGTVSNQFDVIITYGGKDVTEFYKISQKIFGNITVEPRNVILKPEDAKLSFEEYVMDYMPYNKPFTHSVIEVKDNIYDENDGLAYGHSVEFITEGEDDRVTTGEIFLPGKVENSVIESKIIILNELGEDVTKNYNIMTEIGYLEIS